jgi:hypothetical protein
MTIAEQAPVPEERSRRRGSTLLRIGLAVICLALLAMWIYAFFFATKEAAYRVDDDAWRERAEAICAAARAERLELVDTEGGFISDPTPEQAIERAAIVDRATAILEAQVADIVSVQPPSDRDRSLISDYEAFWAILIADRRAYTDQLRAYDLSPYSETAVEGGPVTNVLIDFAVVNLMPSCAPPDELGTGG